MSQLLLSVVRACEETALLVLFDQPKRDPPNVARRMFAMIQRDIAAACAGVRRLRLIACARRRGIRDGYTAGRLTVGQYQSTWQALLSYSQPLSGEYDVENECKDGCSLCTLKRRVPVCEDSYAGQTSKQRRSVRPARTAKTVGGDLAMTTLHWKWRLGYVKGVQSLSDRMSLWSSPSLRIRVLEVLETR
jgi:hypothetical protein